MKTINWIKCSDRIPPDDDSKEVIIRSKLMKPICISKYDLRYCLLSIPALDSDFEWIPYDEQTWKELSKS